jgi:MoxR-like ATPase
MHLDYSRIQFTPDLMPGDILGSMIMESDGAGKQLRFQRGPIFSHLVLADEINRATPRTQSALLEAMQEKTVTSGTTTYKLDDPFLVMATQNPLEMEGTYPLPEAQLDRFLMKILVGYPSEQEMATILDRTVAAEHPTLDQVVDREQILDMRRAASQVLVAPHVRDFAIRVVLATQPEHEYAHDLAKRFIRYGSSPRGAQSLIMCGRVQALMRGRLNVSTGDVRSLALSALRHRIILNFDAHAEGHTADTVLNGIMAGIPEPGV